jgi:ATP-binding cassette, subfamily B, bacterial CvaB/MchF/RaxB
LLVQRAVLVLDEATSHLDVPLERAVNAAVTGLALTRIIVAHRPETIASARRVIALVDGSIAQELALPDKPPPA